MSPLNETAGILLCGGTAVFLLVTAKLLFNRVDRLMDVPAHQEVTRADRHLPLQGRWLGYLLSAVLLPLAFIAVLAGGMLLFNTFIALLMLLFGALVGLIGLLAGPR